MPKSNEREIAIWLCEQLNRMAETGAHPFKEALAETGVKNQGRTLFPDIVLWKNRAAGEAFAYMEIKQPGKIEDLDTFLEKALNLNVKYGITWNFDEAVLYTFEDQKLNKVKSYSTYVISDIAGWMGADVKLKLKNHLQQFIADINELDQRGHLHDFIPDKHFFVKLLHDSVHKLHTHFAEHLKIKIRDRELKHSIEQWATTQGIANVGDENFYATLSRQWAYRLISKLLFYLTIRRHFKGLPDLEVEAGTDVEQLLRSAFMAARRIDWHSVFEEDILEKTGVPQSSKDVLAELLQDMKQYNFGQLQEDVVGQIFEELIPPQERHLLGQYFTREDLVDFIIGFVANNPEGYYCDPTCGSGTFLNRLYSRLHWLSGNKKQHHELLNQIWGIDIAHFPAELATINLFKNKIGDYTNFPHVDTKDFFSIYPGFEFEFPPPKVDNDQFTPIKIKIPQFSGMVGNFPFIRQEIIEKKNEGYKDFLVKTMAADWLADYPAWFEAKKLRPTDLEHFGKSDYLGKQSVAERWAKDGSLGLRLSGQADIYTYLYPHAARFAEKGGRMGFITSNSWLDVSYGSVLKEFLLDHFKVVAVVVSWAEPWFEDAAVNTVFTILERCPEPEKRDNNVVKFVKLNKKLAELIPFPDLVLQESDRWNKIDALVRRIETSESKFLKIENGRVNCTLNGVETVENDDFSIRLVKQQFLRDELKAKGQLDKWGKYLRAPKVYFDILDKAKDKLVPLKDVADFRRGYTTGINEFFYLEPIEKPKAKDKKIQVTNAKGWQGEIEAEFLKPVIKSPKEAEGIVIDKSKLKNLLFICNLSKAELKKQGYKGALEYIEWGEKQKTENGMAWSKVPSVTGRKYWWSLTDKEPGNILLPMINDQRFVIYHNHQAVYVDHNLFELLVAKKEAALVVAVLNSTLYALIREVNSRVNLGEGATKTEGTDWQNSIPMPDIQKISEKAKGKIIDAYNVLKVRRIESVSEEVKSKDRQKLDAVVLEALGLNAKEYLPKIYEGITQLVAERLELPKMRRKANKAGPKASAEDIKKVAEEEIIGDGLKQFPHDFVDARELNKTKDVSVPGTALKVGHQFLGVYDIVNQEGKKVTEVDSLEEARFVVYSVKPNVYVLKVPKTTIVVNKAVKEYRRYLKGIKEKLITRLFQGTHDHKQAQNLAEEIFKEHGLEMDWV
ncbi:MAG: N-6 DNA methylase [Candidatus Edwardsbacteria bacterium]|nr:N-6 DNA methylase [Candidatus Edwardsbacteria bacterium]MBU2464590.1 N-6 DNA methylase [Candidatus Edwardsbacteria bacterium]MBU2593372.1 N-6 DNA methylase [Candidatus Edwardsbacteria bacterium]